MTEGDVGLAMESVVMAAAAGNSVVTSFCAPRLTTMPSADVPGVRSHVDPSQTWPKVPTLVTVGFAVSSPNAATATSSVSTVTVAALTSRATLDAIRV